MSEKMKDQQPQKKKPAPKKAGARPTPKKSGERPAAPKKGKPAASKAVRKDALQQADDPHKPQRIAKVIARAGICSRRDAEVLVTEGRVKLNGKVLQTAAQTVTPQDIILIDDKPLPGTSEPRVFRYHKPAGLVTTNKDEKGRPTVFDKLPPELPRVVTVGRLDINTEGLLLLTNDGEIAGILERPDTGWSRRYRVRVHGRADAQALKQVGRGVTIDGVKYAPAKVEFDAAQSEGVNQWLTITLHEGKNREVKRLLEHCGLQVNRLIRLSYGPFQLGKLPRGAVEEIKPRILKDQVPGFAAKLKDARPKIKPQGSKHDAELDRHIDDL